MRFEWDPEKNLANIKKHRIDFRDAAKVFLGIPYVARSDRNKEKRFIAVGEVNGRIITVAYTLRGDVIRIISARKARDHEKEDYRALQRKRYH